MTSADQFASALNYVAVSRASEVEAHLASRAGAVARIEGNDIIDRESFLRRAGVDLFGRPLQNWSQFDDLLRTAVAEAPGEEYALVWTGAHRMLEGGLEDLVTVADICLAVARARSAHGHRFRAFLLGEGPNFR